MLFGKSIKRLLQSQVFGSFISKDVVSLSASINQRFVCHENHFHRIGFLATFLITIIFSGCMNSFAQDADPKVVNNENIVSKEIGDVSSGMKAENDSESQSPQADNSQKKTDSLIKKVISSFMFSGDELEKIEQATDAKKSSNPLVIDVAKKEEIYDQNSQSSYVYLGSILYNSPNNWSVWINDQKISFSNNKPDAEIYIKSIDADKVTIVWTMTISKWKILTQKKSEDNIQINSNNQVAVDFPLSFNQTYILASGLTVEGKVVNLSSDTPKKPESSDVLQLIKDKLNYDKTN